MNVQFRSFESLALDQPLRFDPPLGERSPRAEAFTFQWKLMQYAFPLPDPRGFSAFDVKFSASDLERLQRYCDAAYELAESGLLSADQSVTVHIDHPTATEKVEPDFVSKEITRGYSVLFRQFFADEPASFSKVWNILSKANKEVSDEESPRRQDELQEWRRAHAALRNCPLKVLVGKELAKRGLYAGAIPGDGPPFPQELINMYNYGELIHWGRYANDLAALGVDEFSISWNRLRFLEAAVGLTHLYLGFSLLVRAAVPDVQ